MKLFCKKRKKLISEQSNQAAIETINEKSIYETSSRSEDETQSEETNFKKIIDKLFSDIENFDIKDAIIKEDIEQILRDDLKNYDRLRLASYDEKRECLLKEDLKNFTRLNGLKYKEENYSLLHWSAKYQRDELCAYLIDKVIIDVNIQSKNKMTPLHLLIDFYDTDSFNHLNNKLIETFQIFLNRNIDVNLQDDSKSTILHLAIKKPNYTAVELLLNQSGLNLSLQDENEMNPLQVACKIGNEEITNLIINKLVEQNKYELLHHETFFKSPIYLTVSNRYEKYTTFRLLYFKLKNFGLLENILSEYDLESKNLLEKSFENGHYKILDLILNDYNAKNVFNTNGELIIHSAAKYGSKELLDILIKHDCVSFEVNKSNGENALHIASNYNRFEFIKSLLAYETNSDKTGVNKPMIQIKNMKKLTPLQLAIIKKYDRCVKELLVSNEIELDVVEKVNNYSIYHLCILHSDFESLNFLLGKNEKKFTEPLFIRSKTNETPLHLACKLGQLESVKLIVNKLILKSASSVESYLSEQNREGRTCFHLASIYGHYSIIEYFLIQLNMMFFIEINDNDFNTCLLLASQNGHERIVELLLNFDANVKAKNTERSNVLEISCRKGYFEMAKIIISKLDSTNEDINYFNEKNNLLYLASQAGANDIVKILLKRGIQLDCIDERNQNCLDIAIEKSHSDVIKELLSHSNWLKLFHINNKSKVIQSKQFEKLIENKMWDMIQLLLDKCQIKNNSYTDKSYDFRLLDPTEFKSLDKHPLMMIANSGQEQLLTHSTVLTLLELKWHKIPRSAYIFNIIIHLIFLVLFTMYSFDLIEIKRLPENSNKISNDNNVDSIYDPYLLSIMSLIGLVMVLKLILAGPFSYIFKMESWIAIIVLVLSFLSVTSNDLSLKITFCSLSLIFIYLQFAFLIQKLKLIGLYVLAFRGTIKNSAKFFPIFFLIYAGFVISFRVRTGTSDIQYFNDTTPEIFIKGLTLVLGNFNDDQMGLKSSFINYILYALFIIILSIIILNLFVGIAVGEVTQLLAKATVQQISLRVIFVLQVQYSIKFISSRVKMFQMTYNYYDYSKNESKLVQLIDKLMISFRHKLNKSNPEINLIDSITRLDSKMDTMVNFIENEQIKLKSSLLIQLNYIQSKLNLSQSRVEENLKETSRRSNNNMETLETSTTNNLVINEKLDTINNLLVDLIDNNNSISNLKLYQHLNTNENVFQEKLVVLEATLANLMLKLDKLDSESQLAAYKLNLICSHLE